MGFHWLSFVLGGLVGVGIISMWQKRLDRLRWTTLRRAVAAGITIEQYARDLPKPSNGIAAIQTPNLTPCLRQHTRVGSAANYATLIRSSLPSAWKASAMRSTLVA